MDRLSQLAMNAKGFVFDPACGESFTVNTSGMLILRGLQEMKSSQQIAHELADEYDLMPKIIERDVLDFMSHLRTLKLL